jgi:energy-converting hydrogenase Eha subunit C
VISAFAADFIGLVGSVIFIGAFIYANRAPVMDKLVFNALNLAGAAMLLISLYVHFNLAAVVLEVAWAAIALTGLITAIRQRRRARK